MSLVCNYKIITFTKTSMGWEQKKKKLDLLNKGG